MSLLRSIHTLLGGAYRANEYNSGFDKKESGTGYYTHTNGNVGYYTLQSSVTDKADADPQMPERYSIEADIDGIGTPRALKRYVPPLVIAAHTSQIINSPADIDHNVRNHQVICCIPVYGADNRIKGVVQHRASSIGATPTEGIFPERVALAEYVTRTLAPLFDPHSPAQTPVTRRELNTIDGTIAWLAGLRDKWQEGIQSWSSETFQHTRRVTELCDMMVDGINHAQSGPMSAITIPEKERQLFKLSAELHDLGKLYTPRYILESGVPVPGARYELSAAESTIMERHAQDVYDALDIPGLDWVGKVRDICGAHHLLANGSGGYPEPVRKALMEKNGIPFESKLLTVADIFEALTADREYREGIGLPLSTSLTIMHNMAKRNAIDPQLFRFAVETGIFEAYAAGKQHISRYDQELLEKLAYTTEDLESAMEEKRKLCREIWPSEGEKKMADLEKILRMGDKKILDKIHLEATKDEAGRDPNFITQAQFARIAEIKRAMNESMNWEVKDVGGRPRQFYDHVYIDRLLTMSQADIEQLSALKRDLAHTLWNGSVDDKTAVTRLENMAKSELLAHRALKLGIATVNADDLASHSQGLYARLTEMENEKLRKVKAEILSGIPSQPLSGSENFTLFQNRRYAALHEGQVSGRTAAGRQ